jgi:hypothetical protein
MNDIMENKLLITAEDGTKVEINVLDIIDSYAYNKTFMIYTFTNENKSIFASILNETDTSYSLDTITNQEEIDYINLEINRVSNELVEAN